MPGGIAPNPLGFAVLAGVKWLGYTAVGYALARSWPRPRVNPLALGTARTALGVVVGASMAAFFWSANGVDGLLHWYFALSLIRCAEWWFVIWWFWIRHGGETPKLWRTIVGAIIVSYFLDHLGAWVAIFAGGVDWIIC